MQLLPFLLYRLRHGSIVLQIMIGLVAGMALALLSPEAAKSVAFLGTLFVKALKGVAPILVFVLVATSIAGKTKGVQTNMRPVLVLYLVGTFLAALVGVVASFLSPVRLVLANAATGSVPPGGIGEVLHTLLFQVVDNPVNALATGNFIGILAWAAALGVALHHSSDTTKAMLYDTPQAMHLLLDKLAQSVTSYLNGQILAGAQAVQIFDTWGGNLSAAAYQEFSLAYMRKIVSGLIREHEGRKVPVILFTKNGDDAIVKIQPDFARFLHPEFVSQYFLIHDS